jgi:hypothetical protein
MKFGKRDLQTINGALIRAIEWEESLAEANAHIPEERKKCERKVEEFRKLRMRLFAALNLKAEPTLNVKTVTLDELRGRESKEAGGSKE